MDSSDLTHIDFGGKFIPYSTARQVEKSGDYSIIQNHDGYVNSICKYEENESWINIEYSMGVKNYYLYNKASGRTYQGTSLFQGFMPVSGFWIHGKNISCVVLDDDVEALRRAMKKNQTLKLNELYNESNSVIKQIIDGKISTPVVLYLDIK